MLHATQPDRGHVTTIGLEPRARLWRNMRGDRIFGILLLAIGLVGFLTVADDLSHVGEIVGVSAITISGLILLTASFDHWITRRLPLRWIALGTLAGIVIGTAIDNVLLGVGIGMASGALSGILLRRSDQHTNNTQSE